MTADEFRAVFSRNNHMLPVTLADGTKTLAVGLNGDKVVLHRHGEAPLAGFVELGGLMFQREQGQG